MGIFKGENPHHLTVRAFKLDLGLNVSFAIESLVALQVI